MYLIIGGNGYLGNYIIQSILQNTEEQIIATARKIDNLKNTNRIFWYQCDILDDANFEALVNKVKECKHVKVVFLAAYHHPDSVASNPQYAWNVNVTTLSKCINLLSFVDDFYYASTDSVYGNSYDNYHFKETDLLNPVNIYGHNKCAAEAIVVHYGFHVVRYPFLIGTSLVNGKKHFYDSIVSDLQNGKPVEMFSDSYRSSLNFKTAADLMIELIESKQTIPSIINVCGDKDLSKYDIGLMIADKLNISRDYVIPIKMEENGQIFQSKRATSTLMDNTRLKEILKINEVKFIL